MDGSIIGDLRSLLARPPSATLFARICGRLGGCDLADEIVEYLAGQLARWPAQIRRPLPLEWLDRARALDEAQGWEHSPWASFRLANTLDLRYTRGDDNEWWVLEGLAFVLERRPEALSSIRVLDAGWSSLAARPEEGPAHLLERLVACPGLGGLVELDLTGADVPWALLEALGDAAHLRELERLRLSNNVLGWEPLDVLARSPLLGQLTTLTLRDCYLSSLSLEALASSPHVGRLRVLMLDWNPDRG